ncbi:MAG: hypothetical protein KY475_12975 [Planctomycetes bacterium]|nr:hypothetical protein [Planctomycetota bacterium]
MIIPVWIEVVAIAAFAAGEGVLLAAIRPRLRGATLTAAWWWAVLATYSLTLLALPILLLDPGARNFAGADALHYAAAMLTFCPAMAVLGAKRPQHHPWQIVVVSLWAVLALPALEAFVLRRGQSLEISGVRAAFLLGLIGVGVLNWLPTRFCPAALLAAAGQGLLLAEFVFDDAPIRLPRAWALAAACFVAATTWVLVQQRAGGGDRVWRDFRDGFGALWALRVAERVNAAASAHDWPVRLRWSGFVPVREESSPSQQPASPGPWEAELSSLLRRFVSPEWIANRR